MLAPGSLLRHAERLLARSPDEADLRRAISAAYYAVFNLLIAAAADTQTGVPDQLRDPIRRSIDHGDVRQVCIGVSKRHGARPALLQQFLMEPVSAGLVASASYFVELQAARLDADYNLGRMVPLRVLGARARVAVDVAQTVLDTWPALVDDPNTRTFLAAILFYKRWARRP